MGIDDFPCDCAEAFGTFEDGEVCAELSCFTSLSHCSASLLSSYISGERASIIATGIGRRVVIVKVGVGNDEESK